MTAPTVTERAACGSCGYVWDELTRPDHEGRPQSIEEEPWTCPLCSRPNGELLEDYTTPSGHSAREAHSSPAAGALRNYDTTGGPDGS